jgi:hypothetical protein
MKSYIGELFTSAYCQEVALRDMGRFLYIKWLIVSDALMQPRF